VLGNHDPIALPPIELDFSGLPDGVPHVLDSKAKWDENSAAYKGTKSVLADLPDELRAKLQKVSVDAYRALRVRDYGRVDLRLTDTGDIYVLEVNASCYLARDSEFAMAAGAAGIPYPALIQRIVDLATDRYRRGAGLRSRPESAKKTPENGRKGWEGGRKVVEDGKKAVEDGKKGAESARKTVES
jgi:D-alanine-D-alanine ligase